MARPTALAPLGTIIRGLGATLEGIGAGMADTFSREKCLALLPLISSYPTPLQVAQEQLCAQQQFCMNGGHSSSYA